MGSSLTMVSVKTSTVTVLIWAMPFLQVRPVKRKWVEIGLDIIFIISTTFIFLIFIIFIYSQSSLHLGTFLSCNITSPLSGQPSSGHFSQLRFICFTWKMGIARIFLLERRSVHATRSLSCIEPYQCTTSDSRP